MIVVNALSEVIVPIPCDLFCTVSERTLREAPYCPKATFDPVGIICMPEKCDSCAVLVDDDE